MVIRESNNHDRPDNDLPIDDDRLLLDRVHAQHGSLGEVDDGRSVERSEDATIGAYQGTPVSQPNSPTRIGDSLHGECASGHVFECEFTVPGLTIIRD